MTDEDLPTSTVLDGSTGSTTRVFNLLPNASPMDRSLRHKLDADGSSYLAPRTDERIGKDDKNMVFHKQTGKPRLWH